MRRIAAFLLLFLALPPAGHGQYERIPSFDSQITVEQDGSLTVRDVLVVLSTGTEIRHGIYRDFPTEYTTPYGDRVVTGFDVLEVTRDGHSEPFRVTDYANGKRVYIGSKEIELTPGEHRYTILYTTTNQIAFLQGFDELYWNVTGNGWGFTIDKATAVVHLPGDASQHILGVEAFTGPAGARERDYSHARDNLGDVTFATTMPLPPGCGLTISVKWPKGFVHEPTMEERASAYVQDNPATIVIIFGLLLLLGYYIVVWAKVGKDPEKGTIIPLFEPPAHLSAGAMRFVSRMGFDMKTFAAAVIDLAARGYLSITEEDGTYTLTRKNPDTSGLTAIEVAVLALFSGGDEIVLKNTNHERISSAIKKLRKALSAQFEKQYFVRNIWYFIPGAIFSALLITGCLLYAPVPEAAIFATVWLSMWSVGVAALLVRVISSWKTVIATGFRGISTVTGTLFLSAFALPFVGGEVLGIYFLSSAASTAMIVASGAIIFVNYLFYRLLKAPTRAGRRLMDGIDGFKMYLGTAEKERLNVLNPPDRTPQLFEKYLPYALALNVEQAWSEQFAGVLSAAGAESGGYHPAWYSGSGWRTLGATGFSSALGSSFTSAISSSSTAPGSGSGGGGSSGGGGGGGGGGGW